MRIILLKRSLKEQNLAILEVANFAKRFIQTSLKRGKIQRGKMKLGFKTLDDVNVKGKVVLVRVDLNSEIAKGRVVLSDRIREHAKTIKELVKKKARVVVLAHQGQPGKRDFISLREHCKLLNRSVKISFVKDVCGELAVREIKELKNGEAILLENVRFEKDEFDSSNDSRIVNVLGKLGDLFVSDAFSLVHRNHASIIGLPRVMKSCIGRVIEKELLNISKIKMRNALFILGGAKSEDNLLLLRKKKILATGVFSLLCLIAKGHDLGMENRRLKGEVKIVKEIKKNLKNIKMPVDLAIKKKGRRKDMVLDGFPQNSRVLDIGIKTIKMYEKEIMKAKRIFWKGTAGYVENKDFALGTKRLLKAVEKSKAFCVVAGGHSSTAIEQFGIKENKIGYVSLSGGALIHYLAGKKLPGLEVLRK